jgi:serine/threonine protein kinase/tetratricopeptide (TPR) repeat protein
LNVTKECPKCHTENPSDTSYCGKCGTKLSVADRGARQSLKDEISVTKTLEATPDELARGTIFAGRYEIIEELGTGGMGKVYRAFDKQLELEVALKLLKPEIAADKKTIGRFKNELKLARQITHKNICRMHDLHEEGKTLYITMEYVQGEDLKSVIRRMEKLTVGKAVSVARQVAEGLVEAHKLGVVHRDLKPQNIMIDKEGNAKIMDFGIARSLRGAGITGEGAIIGTPEYMSPEQVEGKEADQRSDIYSLGIILFEMVTGRVPFEGDTPLSVAYKHKNEIPPAPRKLNSQISDDLNRLILHCLEKSKENRYQTVEEFLGDLARIEEGIPTAERPVPKRKPTISKEITVKITPKKLLIPAAGLAVLIIAALFLWRLFRPGPVALVPSGKPSLAVLPFENYSGDSSLENWRYGFPELLITGLSSSKYLKVLRQDEVNGVLKKLNLTEGKALTSDNIKKIAQEAEVTSLLKSSFVKAGPNFIITAALVSGQTGETQATLSMKAQSIENILGGGLDGLVKEIKQGLNITEEQMASDIDVEIGKVMTRNPEALKYYVEGERLHLDLKSNEAVVSLKKAVELDPEFAMAYRLLGAIYENLEQYAKSRENYEKAFRLKDRMPPREYYILQGSYYGQSEATYPKAIEMFKKVLDIYPDDYLGNHMLGVKYGVSGELNLAVEHYSKILKSRPRDLLEYSNLSELYSMLGEKESATQTMKEFVANNPGNDLGHLRLCDYYIMQRRFDLAMQELDQAITLCPDKRVLYTGLKGDIYYLKDDPEEAAGSYRAWLDNAKSDEEKGNAVYCLANVDILKGRPEEALTRMKSYQKLYEKTDPLEFHFVRGFAYMAGRMPELALEEFKKAEALVPESEVPQKRGGYFWEAIAQLEIGNLPEAEKLTREIDRLIPEPIRKAEGYVILYLRGRLELAGKNLSDARKLLDEALAHCPGENYYGSNFHINALCLDGLASACLETGDVDNALKDYEKITLLTIDRYSWGDLYAKSFYNQGKIYEQIGLKSKAGENYKKFIRLWKDCEPRFRPLVEDAKKHLQSL